MSASRITTGALTAVIAVAALVSPTSAAFVPAPSHQRSSPFIHGYNTFQTTTIAPSVGTATATTSSSSPTTSLHSSTNRDGFYNFFNDEEFDDEDEDEDEYEKYRHLSKTEKQQMTKKFFEQMKMKVKPEEVHIILFNPNTDREGVHTIEFPKDSGNNIILAFESRMECERFSTNLKEQHFFDPVPQEMNLDSLEQYCETIGVDVQVVPEGTDLKPPKEKAFNLGLNPDLEKEMELLDYLFEISESDNGDMGLDMTVDHEAVSQVGAHSIGGGDGLAGGTSSTGAWE
eukprot:CAMPEP_0203644610 /NCGR_PEP_ID=MMETSP0088-20131115/10020_1 /ASSEMBLY_ACC=CAM_ASM_001087 /TAXON_ID=426623 /ORGANISM="Chaetoceros affinis, Strain CCMP159" /LENGTH=286 /DNA_ID=CAMNT_0050501189 /DNA_START=468 /DNA_END=1328 /DNA_ORIENTATION=-